jgi:hypothetical protein
VRSRDVGEDVLGLRLDVVILRHFLWFQILGILENPLIHDDLQLLVQFDLKHAKDVINLDYLFVNLLDQVFLFLFV